MIAGLALNEPMLPSEVGLLMLSEAAHHLLAQTQGTTPKLTLADIRPAIVLMQDAATRILNRNTH